MWHLKKKTLTNKGKDLKTKVRKKADMNKGRRNIEVIMHAHTRTHRRKSKVKICWKQYNFFI